MAWLTWSGLDVDREERITFRRAGISVGDFLSLTPAEMADATADRITESRAAELCRRASLLQIATPARVASLERAGVMDRDDLASRDPDDLFRAWQDVSPYTGPVAHDVLAALIHAARGETTERSDPVWWRTQRDRSGFDPMRISWRYRYGDGPEPWPIGGRLRIPSVRINATIAAAERDEEGLPLPPFRHKDVTVPLLARPDAAMTFVGHWMWAGRQAAFFRVDNLERGAVVEVALPGQTLRSYEVTELHRGIAPLTPAAPDGGVLLITAPHLRWAVWFKTWDLPEGIDPERAWVQVAAIAEPA